MEILNNLKNTEKELVNKLISIALENSDMWVIITDENGIIEYANKTVEKLSKYNIEELIGKKTSIFKSNLHSFTFYRKLWNSIKKGKIFNAIIINKDKEGNLFYLKDKIIPIEYKGMKKYISIAIDITKEKQLLSKIKNIKNLDAVTNLYSKEYFLNEVNKIISKKTLSTHFFILVDIHHFSGVNELIGFENGNILLQKIAKKLKQTFKSALISRANADEFAIFLKNSNEKELLLSINKIKTIFEKPFIIDNHHIKLLFNIGISTYPKDGNKAKELLSKASIALKSAKQKGPNIIKTFNNFLKEDINNYLHKINLIKEYLEKNNFTLFFQPYVNSQTKKIVGAESLLRIRTDNEIISAIEYIELIEKNNFINKLTLNLLSHLENILPQINIKISFNLSSHNFYSEKIKKKLIKLSSKYKEQLVFEITESAAINNFSIIKEFLEEIKNNSSLISLDDFGTGYSSLTYLEKLPIDFIKIDQSFVKYITTSSKNRYIIKSIIDLAKALNLKTIAEGVEEKDQYEILKSLGIDYIQGYYFYKPLDKKSLLKVLNVSSN